MNDEDVFPNFSPPEASEIAPIQAFEPAHSQQALYQPEQTPHEPFRQGSPLHHQHAHPINEQGGSVPPAHRPYEQPPQEEVYPDYPLEEEGIDDSHLNEEAYSPSEEEEVIDESLAMFGELFKEFSAAVRDWQYDNKRILDTILDIFIRHALSADQLADRLDRIIRHFDNYFIEITTMPQAFLDQLFPHLVCFKALSHTSNGYEMDLSEGEQVLDFPAISLFERVWQAFFQEARGSLLLLDTASAADREQARLLVKLANRIPSIGPYWLVYTLR